MVRGALRVNTKAHPKNRYTNDSWVFSDGKIYSKNIDLFVGRKTALCVCTMCVCVCGGGDVLSAS